MMMDIHCRNISDSVSFMPFVMVASHAALGSFLSASVISAPLDFLLAMLENERFCVATCVVLDRDGVDDRNGSFRDL